MGRLKKNGKSTTMGKAPTTGFVGQPHSNLWCQYRIADYSHFSEEYLGENGPLIWIIMLLKETLDRARAQFKDVPRRCGLLNIGLDPIRTYEDEFKLIEVPYLGMEHQSAVTYGNGYQQGYKG